MRSKNLTAQMLVAALTLGMGAGRVYGRGNQQELIPIDDFYHPSTRIGNQYPAFSSRECERRLRQAACNTKRALDKMVAENQRNGEYN